LLVFVLFHKRTKPIVKATSFDRIIAKESAPKHNALQ